MLGISEESEEIADFLKSNLYQVGPDRIRRLLTSTDAKVRWQVYDSLIEPQKEWLEVLIGGMNDPDAYVRRRAFLRLLDTIEVPRTLLEAAVGDSDSVIRTEAEARLSNLAGGF